MRVGQLIDFLAKLDPELEIGMVQWKAPNFTTWEAIPIDFSMVDATANRTEVPENASMVVFHRA
jgi:hypothetical protein